MADLVVLAPHMDDETLGCGGVLAQSEDALVVFGVQSRDQRIEIDQVASLLGFRYTVLYGKEYEARLLGVDRRELVAKIETILREETPKKVLVPSPSYHQDHTTILEAGVAATRPLSREGYVAQFVASYEYPGSAWRRGAREDELNYFVPIGDVIERKIAAASLYRSQDGRAVIEPDIVRSWARLRGAFVGLDYAEAFHVFRYVDRPWQ
jgi:LmbE family N-acetylglucosaminyl deacetylase